MAVLSYLLAWKLTRPVVELTHAAQSLQNNIDDAPALPTRRHDETGMLARAFEPFYKADKARTRSAGGVGLGLSFAKRVAELHGATLTLHSTLGKGTTATFDGVSATATPAYRYQNRLVSAVGGDVLQ